MGMLCFAIGEHVKICSYQRKVLGLLEEENGRTKCCKHGGQEYNLWWTPQPKLHVSMAAREIRSCWATCCPPHHHHYSCSQECDLPLSGMCASPGLATIGSYWGGKHWVACVVQQFFFFASIPRGIWSFVVQSSLHSSVHHRIPVNSRPKVDVTEYSSTGLRQQRCGVYTDSFCAAVQMSLKDIMVPSGTSLSQYTLLTCGPRTRKRNWNGE